MQAIPAQKLLIEAVKSYASLQHVKSRVTFFRKLMCKQNRLPLHQNQHTIMAKVKQETISINKDTELAKRFRDYCEQRNLSRPEALRQLMNDAQRSIDIEGFMNRIESVLSNVEALLSDTKCNPRTILENPICVDVQNAKVHPKEIYDDEKKSHVKRYFITAVVNGQLKEAVLDREDLNDYYERDNQGNLTKRISAYNLALKYFGKEA